jgi:methyl-accepting chemotaxis protein
MSSQAEQLQQAMSFFTLDAAAKSANQPAKFDGSSGTSNRKPSRPAAQAPQKSFAYNMASTPDESEFTRF